VSQTLLRGLLETGEQVAFRPARPDGIEVGDRLLVTVRGRLVVREVRARGDGRLLVGSSRAGLSWVPCPTPALVARAG